MKDTTIKSVLLLGSGPIVIGQGCEFDYAGTQAVKALREEGVRVILLNSNPATIMTDPDVASRTYIEPMTPEVAEQIIAQERPDALLATMGGQTALNLAKTLAERGVLDKYGVRLIGASLHAIARAEDRSEFKRVVSEAGVPLPRSGTTHTLEGALKIASELGYPVVARTSFTLGGSGGGIAQTPEELEVLCRGGFHEPVLIEECLVGWKEFELEVMRDTHDNCIVVCAIENIDPMGVHTGDSITVAPPMTITDRQLQEMRNLAFKVVRAVTLNNGGCNIQLALDPRSGRIVVIEMNPRVSRSSALASKATGYPIAKIAAKLALGYTLAELRNDITRVTTAAFEPTLDYVVVKLPRFDFDKFPSAPARLGPAMHAVGEVMAIGRTFKEAFDKAVRSLDVRRPPSPSPLAGEGSVERNEAQGEGIAEPTPDRIFHVLAALEAGVPVDEIASLTHIDPWFLHAMKQPSPTGPRVFRRVDTCAGEFVAHTPYLYSTYGTLDEAAPSDRKKVLILGSGPNRIGQGIEFDYCCVHAAMALKEAGYETLMLNSNPETVSTDPDTSDKLYFEPITQQDVSAVIAREKPDAVIVQLGGQAPLKLAKTLPSIAGTSADAIDRCEDRQRFAALIDTLGLRQPENGIATTLAEARTVALRLGFPLLVRPSYVLGGRAMRVVHDIQRLDAIVREALGHADSVLLDRFLADAIEVDLDLLRDHTGAVVVCGVLEHVEEAGVHSGDAACIMPPHTLSPELVETLKEQAIALAEEVGVVGFLNVQFAVVGKRIYVIEANPRASRTIPFIAKATGRAIAKIGARVMLGETLAALGLTRDLESPAFAAKESVLPFRRFKNADSVLGPEMKSTGEVMGRGATAAEAFYKAQEASGQRMPSTGHAYFAVDAPDRAALVDIARRLVRLGLGLRANDETAVYLRKKGLDVAEAGEISLIVSSANAPMRRYALEQGVAYFTTVEAARMAVLGMEARQHGSFAVTALQETSI